MGFYHLRKQEVRIYLEWQSITMIEQYKQGLIGRLKLASYCPSFIYFIPTCMSSQRSWSKVMVLH